jgi:hypothetical protein
MTIHVEPNPAPEGGRVTITVDGPGPYFIRVAGSDADWQPLDLDPETNRATIDTPGRAGGSMEISDLNVVGGDHASVPIDGSN